MCTRWADRALPSLSIKSRPVGGLYLHLFEDLSATYSMNGSRSMASYRIEIPNGSMSNPSTSFRRRACPAENVQAFLHRILDNNEVLADAGGAEPYGTLSPDGPLVPARASPIHGASDRATGWRFRVSWQLRRQLSRLVAPYLREESTIAGCWTLEYSAGNIFIDKLAKRTHRPISSRNGRVGNGSIRLSN